MKFLKILRSS